MNAPLRSRLPLLAGAALLGLLPLGFAQKEKEDAPEAFAKLQRGMTPEQVRQRVGPPRRIARQILSHRYLEQWSYGPPTSARLRFDCPRGQNPQLVSIAHIPAPKDEPAHDRGPR